MDKYEWRRLKKIALRKQTLQTVGLKKTKQNENKDSKKSLFCILRKQTLQTVGQKNRFFSHPV